MTITHDILSKFYESETWADIVGYGNYERAKSRQNLYRLKQQHKTRPAKPTKVQSAQLSLFKEDMGEKEKEANYYAMLIKSMRGLGHGLEDRQKAREISNKISDWKRRFIKEPGYWSKACQYIDRDLHDEQRERARLKSEELDTAQKLAQELRAAQKAFMNAKTIEDRLKASAECHRLRNAACSDPKQKDRFFKEYAKYTQWDYEDGKLERERKKSEAHSPEKIAHVLNQAKKHYWSYNSRVDDQDRIHKKLCSITGMLNTRPRDFRNKVYDKEMQYKNDDIDSANDHEKNMEFIKQNYGVYT